MNTVDQTEQASSGKPAASVRETPSAPAAAGPPAPPPSWAYPPPISSAQTCRATAARHRKQIKHSSRTLAMEALDPILEAPDRPTKNGDKHRPTLDSGAGELRRGGARERDTPSGWGATARGRAKGRGDALAPGEPPCCLAPPRRGRRAHAAARGAPGGGAPVLRCSAAAERGGRAGEGREDADARQGARVEPVYIWYVRRPQDRR